MKKAEKIKEFVETLDMPSWCYINGVEADMVEIDITYYDSYHIKIYPILKKEHDCIVAESGCDLGYRDIQFALNIFDRRDEIIEMVKD